ncbi:MAG: hypothetical protein ABI261_09630 [Ginsengibacter sp.]
MDISDIYEGRQVDIILENFSIGPLMMKYKDNWKHAPTFIILKNIGK